MKRETFLSYHRFVWLWITSIGLVLMSLIYLWHDPVGGANGGTMLGYTYGGIATAGIVFLMWYGIRKRAYHSRVTTLMGTLSAHVWIGLALILVVPLHSGFSFGLNVHTLAYVLMLLTIVTGIWGVIMFRGLPSSLSSQRGGGTIKQLLANIINTSSEIDKLVKGSSTETTSGQKSDAFLSLAQKIDFNYKASFYKSLLGSNPQPINNKVTASLLSSLPGPEQEHGLQLIQMVNRKRLLASQIQDETRAQTLIRGWLFIHLPISVGLVVAVAIHILSVFFYW